MAYTKTRDGRVVRATPETPSRRKPHSWWPGYVAERHNSITGDYNVLVASETAGLDAAGGRWAVICNAHGTILNHTNQRVLRDIALADSRGSLEWCDECREIAAT